MTHNSQPRTKRIAKKRASRAFKLLMKMPLEQFLKIVKQEKAKISTSEV